MRKPPKNTQCDAHVGWEMRDNSSPVAIRCPNMATQTIAASNRVMFDTYVCDDCAIVLRKKYETVP